MTSPDQSGSGALITDHPFTPMKDHPEGCGFYPAKPHDPQGVTSSPCRWPRERHASRADLMTEDSGAGSTVEDDPLNDPYLGLPASLSVLQNELNKCGLPGEVRSPIAQRIAAIREGVIELQRTLLRERKADIWVADAWVSRAALDAARSESQQRKADIDYLLAQLARADNLIEQLARAQSRNAALERVVEAARMHASHCGFFPTYGPDSVVGPLNRAIRALDAAQATAEAER